MTEKFDIDTSTLEQCTSEDGFRIYRDSKKREFISCTTLLGIYEDKTGLIKWEEKLGKEQADKERNQAAARGTAAHLELEKYLEQSNSSLPSFIPAVLTSPFSKNAWNGFYDCTEPMEMESMVAYTDGTVGFAGQFDSLVRVRANSFMCDGELLPEMIVISDLKTKKQAKTIRQEFMFKHLLQLSAYVVAKELQSGIKIDGAVIVFSYPKSCKTYYLSRYKINHYWSIFQALMDDYFNVKPLQLTWKYMVAQSEYKWNDDYGIFESFAPVRITKVKSTQDNSVQV